MAEAVAATKAEDVGAGAGPWGPRPAHTTYAHVRTRAHHCQITLVLFHLTKGTPFDDDSQGKMRNLTFWEQIDGGVQFSATRKFLTAVPVLLYVGHRGKRVRNAGNAGETRGNAAGTRGRRAMTRTSD